MCACALRAWAGGGARASFVVRMRNVHVVEQAAARQNIRTVLVLL